MDAAEVLQAANRQLLQENERLKSIIGQRSVDVVGAWIDGVDQLEAMAARGDQAAQTALGRLHSKMIRPEGILNGR